MAITVAARKGIIQPARAQVVARKPPGELAVLSSRRLVSIEHALEARREGEDRRRRRW
jgi:hypothetical protein